jgi:hypothetical protein
MDKLGFSAYDANGKFIGLAKTAEELRTSFGNLSAEQRSRDMKQIFGTDAVRAATVLYDQGAKGVEGWIKKVNDSGYAAQTAATKLDNLKGDLEGLKGSLETALIGTGEGAQGPLRGLVQGLTNVVNAYNALPDAAKSAVAKVLGATALLGGGAFAFTSVVNGIASVRQAFADLRTGIQNVSATKLTLRLGAGAAGLGLLAIGSQIDDTHKALGTLAKTAGGAALGFAVGGPWGCCHRRRGVPARVPRRRSR